MRTLITRVSPSFETQDLWWVPAALMFFAGDVFTTQVGLALGGVEKNVLVIYLADSVGMGVWGLLSLKVAAIGLLLWYSFAVLGRRRWMVPVLLSAMSLPVICLNAIVIIGLL